MWWVELANLIDHARWAEFVRANFMWTFLLMQPRSDAKAGSAGYKAHHQRQDAYLALVVPEVRKLPALLATNSRLFCSKVACCRYASVLPALPLIEKTPPRTWCSGEHGESTPGTWEPDLILLAFITGNSSLEPLLEGLLAQIHIDMS